MTASLIAFLDALARQPAAAADLHARIAALDVDAATRKALLGRDPQALARAFGDNRTMWCFVATPEDEPKPVDDAPGEAPTREPDDEPGPEPGR